MPARTTWSLLAPTFAVSGLLLIVGLGGAWYVQWKNHQVSHSLGQNLAAAQSAEHFVLALRELRLNLDRFVDTGDVSQLNAAEVAFAAAKQEWHGSPAYELLRGKPDDLLYDRLTGELERLRAEPAGDVQQNAARELIASLDAGLLAAERSLDERQALASAASRKNQEVARRIGFGLLLLGLCGAVAGLLAGFGVARNVHRSLVEISVPVRDIAGRLDEVVGPIKVASNTDFSELDDSLRILSEKVADVVRRLQESQRQSIRHEQLAAVGQLAAGLAHELRNPLMSMKLIVQTAAERGTGAMNGRDLAVLEGEITRLESMLQTFLDFARPPQPEMRAIAVGPLVETTLEVVRPRADQQDVKLHYARHEGPVWIEAAESQVRQLLLNLLLNALDELPGGGNVWVSVEPPSKSTERIAGPLDERAAGGEQLFLVPQVTIRITDDGSGVPADVLDKVFDPFVSTKATGVGLGLAICRQIAESHRGGITVTNRAEGGAEFTVFLPIHSTQQDPAARAPFDDAATGSTPARAT